MRNRRSGFTLVELLIVIVVMGILAAVAIPRFSSNQRSAYTTVRKIVSDLRYTRSLAISSGNRHYLVFTDQVSGSYTKYKIYKRSNPSDIRIGEVRIIPANVTCTVTSDLGDKFSYNYLGECNDVSGTDTVTLNDGSETSSAIVVDMTGRASY